MNDFEFPPESESFLETLRSDVSESQALVFSDWLEEHGKMVLAKTFRKLASALFIVPMKSRLEKLLQTKRKTLPTLVMEGDKTKGFVSMGHSGDFRWRRQETEFIAVRTGIGYLSWREIKEARGKVLVSRLYPRFSFINRKPCSFADRILRNPSLRAGFP